MGSVTATITCSGTLHELRKRPESGLGDISSCQMNRGGPVHLASGAQLPTAPRCHPPASGKGRERVLQQISFSPALKIGDVGELGELPGSRCIQNGKQSRSLAIQTWLYTSCPCTSCHGNNPSCSRTGRDLHPAAGDILVGLRYPPIAHQSVVKPPQC
jgi:hypothetical protein